MAKEQEARDMAEKNMVSKESMDVKDKEIAKL